jgi:recombination protein RecR
MAKLPAALERLINALQTLPGIGPKSAARMAFALLGGRAVDPEVIGRALLDLRKSIVECAQCFNLAEQSPCDVCSDPRRNQLQILVVEEPLDVLAFERTSDVQGVYHVLHGVLNPVEGIGPEKLRVRELIERLRSLGPQEVEVILATNPSLEGEATATYIHRALEEMPHVRSTRIARGLPVGGDLEYADEITLSQSLRGRRSY